MKTSDSLYYLKFKRGESLPQAKLNNSDVILINQLVDEREKLKLKLKSLTNKAIAKKFDVHERTIEKILSGKTWKHVRNAM